MLWKYRHKHHNVFQCPEHDKNSSNNCNKYSDAGSDYNSYDELLEPYILDYNDIHINERGNHTNNEYNFILDDDNIENFLTTTFDSYIPIDEDNDVGNNLRRINDD